MLPLVGVSVKMLQRWDNHSKLPACITPTNYRYYTDEDLRIALGEKPKPAIRKVVVYTQLSSISNAEKSSKIDAPEFAPQLRILEI